MKLMLTMRARPRRAVCTGKAISHRMLCAPGAWAQFPAAVDSLVAMPMAVRLVKVMPRESMLD